ncbi:MAG: phage tail assembly protein [Candidatus Kaistia colombiensis]|nr:MAG: phage tail assembly protein [Kaistia sp.]
MSTDATAAEPASDPTKPIAAFDNEAARFEDVILDWPVTIDGVRYDRITVHRMTVGQIANFLETASKGGAARVRFPMFSVSDAVLDALDADDGDKIDEVTQRFLPRRFQGATA